MNARPTHSRLAARLHRLGPALSLALPALAMAAASDGSSLEACRKITDGTARLACYDALPLAAQAPSGPTPAAQAAPGMPMQAGPAPAAAPSPAAPDPVAAFGLESRREALQEITSSIPGHFEGWSPGTRIRLANGQVWEVTDDASAAYELDNPKVTVRRAALGSFMLDIEGARRSPRVRRVQ